MLSEFQLCVRLRSSANLRFCCFYSTLPLRRRGTQRYAEQGFEVGQYPSFDSAARFVIEKTMFFLQRSLAILFALHLCFAIAVAQSKELSAQGEDLLRTALELSEQGKFDEALAKGKELLSISPNNYRAHVVVGYIYSAHRNLDLASQSYAQAIKLEPNEKQIYLLKAQVDFYRMDTEAAIAGARKAVALDPKFAEAQGMVGWLLKDRPENRAEAIAALRTAIRINPQLVAAYNDLGYVLNEAKQPKEAEAVYREGMLADPKRMSGRFALGRMLVQQDRIKEARELWEGRTSDDDHIRPTFIALLTRAENLRRAQETIKTKPNDPDALVDLGLAVMDGESWVIDGRQNRAIVLIKKALTIQPGYPRAQHALVKAYIEIASYNDRLNKKLDLELAKLRKLDPKLAAELDQYRKEYEGGIITEIKPDPKPSSP